jgi:hypothetical protein
MSFIDNKRQEIDPKIELKLTPKLKVEEDEIELWKVVNVLNEDCDLPIEKRCFLCTPVLLNKEGKYSYFKSCEKTIQEQVIALDQQPDVIHKLDCTIVDEGDNTEVKHLLLQTDSEINHGDKL